MVRGSLSDNHCAVAVLLCNISWKKSFSSGLLSGPRPTTLRPSSSLAPKRLSCITQNSMEQLRSVSLPISNVSASLNTGHTVLRCTPVLRFFKRFVPFINDTFTYGSEKKYINYEFVVPTYVIENDS